MVVEQGRRPKSGEDDSCDGDVRRYVDLVYVDVMILKSTESVFAALLRLGMKDKGNKARE